MVIGTDKTLDAYPVIATFFQRHIEGASLAVDRIAEVAGAAADIASRAILSEKKLFSIGLGADAASAVALASLLQSGVLRERPSLPVIELAEYRIDSVQTSINWVSQRLQALGQAGDVAFVFAANLSQGEIQRIQVATEQRQVIPVWLGQRGPGLSLYSDEDSVECLLTLNHAIAICLARLIETHTFGPVED
jgi:phosphoheptose isomerase